MEMVNLSDECAPLLLPRYSSAEAFVHALRVICQSITVNSRWVDGKIV